MLGDNVSDLLDPRQRGWSSPAFWTVSDTPEEGAGPRPPRLRHRAQQPCLPPFRAATGRVPQTTGGAPRRSSSAERGLASS